MVVVLDSMHFLVEVIVVEVVLEETPAILELRRVWKVLVVLLGIVV